MKTLRSKQKGLFAQAKERKTFCIILFRNRKNEVVVLSKHISVIKL